MRPAALPEAQQAQFTALVNALTGVAAPYLAVCFERVYPESGCAVGVARAVAPARELVARLAAGPATAGAGVAPVGGATPA